MVDSLQSFYDPSWSHGDLGRRSPLLDMDQRLGYHRSPSRSSYRWYDPDPDFFPRRFPGGWDGWRRVPNEWQLLLDEYAFTLIRAPFFFGRVQHMCSWLDTFFHRWGEGYRISPHMLREARGTLRVLADILDDRSELSSRGGWLVGAALGLRELRSYLPKHPELYYDDFEHHRDWDHQLGLPWDFDRPGRDICCGHGGPFERPYGRLREPRLPMLPAPLGQGMGRHGGRPRYDHGPTGSAAPFSSSRMLPGLPNYHDGKTLRRRPLPYNRLQIENVGG